MPGFVRKRIPFSSSRMKWTGEKGEKSFSILENGKLVFLIREKDKTVFIVQRVIHVRTITSILTELQVPNENLKVVSIPAILEIRDVIEKDD
jgi:hypothetical protein